MRIINNLMKLAGHLAVAGVLGYYNYSQHGGMGLATNACFFVMGLSLVLTWQKQERKQSEQPSEKPFSPVTVIDANAANSAALTGKSLK